VRDLALHDDLTGLRNRRAFSAETRGALRHARPGNVSLVLLDIDGLKRINDECGHQAGDELLTIVAKHFDRAAGAAYRIGGDEFAILIDRSSGESTTALLGSLRPLSQRFRACGHEHVIYFSYGVASNRPGESFDQVFLRADAQLRDFKQRLYESGWLRDRRESEKNAAPVTMTKPITDDPVSILSKLPSESSTNLRRDARRQRSS
jgi:diguanylate cyclase (GGDEF)-like protein